MSNNKPLNKYMRGDVKKYKIYKKDPKTGNIRKIEFGDPNMSIKRDNSKNRSQFRDRHKCKTKKDPMKAGYHACKFWSKKPVNQLLKNEKEINMSNELEQYITESHFMMLTEAPSKAKKRLAKSSTNRQQQVSTVDLDKKMRSNAKKREMGQAKYAARKNPATPTKTGEFINKAKDRISRAKNYVGDKVGKVRDSSVGKRIASAGATTGKALSKVGGQLSRPARKLGLAIAKGGKTGSTMRKAGMGLAKHGGKATAAVGLAGAGATYYWRRLKNGKRVKVKKGS